MGIVTYVNIAPNAEDAATTMSSERAERWFATLGETQRSRLVLAVKCFAAHSVLVLCAQRRT